MSERDLTAIERDRIAEWDRASVGRAERTGEPSRAGVAGWVETRLQAAVAHLVDGFSRRSTDLVDNEDAAPLSRTGGGLARPDGAIACWISFPRGVRFATAATSSAAAALAAWGMIAMAANDLGIAAAAAGAAAALSTAWGPIGVRLANRLHRLVARHRLFPINELRGIPDRRSVAVRGIVLARRTSASALDGRQAVWSLTRFRKGS